MIPSFLSCAPALEAEVSSWIGNWPSESREALRKRVFHSKQNIVYPALLELYVHNMLRARFSSVHYEPTLSGTSSRQDFYACDNKGECLLVECKVVFDEDSIQASNAELRRLVNYLNRLQSDHRVSIQPHGSLPAPVTPRRIEAFLKRELSKLDTNVAVGHRLVFQDTETGTAVNFIVMGPKDPDTNTVVSWWLTGDTAQDVTIHERIIAAVDEKATKYGKRDEPFLLVIWPESEFAPLDSFEILRGLYGDEQAHINFVTGQGVRSRARNGAFTRVSSSGDQICTRVSAVGIYSLRFGSPCEYEHRFAIFHNPYAEQPLDPTIFAELPQYIVQTTNDKGGTMGWHEEGRPNWWKT